MNAETLFHKIDRPREIADRKRLLDHINDEVTSQSLTPSLREFLRHGEEEIARRFQQSGRDLQAGRRAARERTYLIDQLLRTLYDIAVIHLFPHTNPTKGEHLALIAIGGYGRGELAPFSDIDLLFIQGYRHNSWAEQIVEFILYRLWDLGLKPGYAVRTLDEALRWAGKDLHAQTSLLEARFIAGEEELFSHLRHRFRLDLINGREQAFCQEKLAERDLRHERMGQSRYSLEPNIKEGKGGLRDLHLLRWIVLAIKNVRDPEQWIQIGLLNEQEAQQFIRAENLLWLLRFHLHAMTGRAEERLSFELQPEMAERLNIKAGRGLKPVERLMRLYFRNARLVGQLSNRLLTRLLDQPSQEKGVDLQGFWYVGKSLAIKEPDQFRKAPEDLIRLFCVAQDLGLAIEPGTMAIAQKEALLINEEVRASRAANELFLQLLTSPKHPETWLRRLNEAKIFGRFMPDFGRIVDQVQFDMYHHYTVDEHTIRAIGKLDRLLAGDFSEDLPELDRMARKYNHRPSLLFLAVLLHDIAKGRDRDHSEVGAEIALQIGPRFGLRDEDTETLSWLVRYHLLMSNTAFRRNLDDPKTLRVFIDRVQTRERLELLLLLTIADIQAVGPKTWTSWKGQLLRDLYLRAEESLSTTTAISGRESRLQDIKAGLKHDLIVSGWAEEEIDLHLAQAPSGYWLGFAKEELTTQAWLLRRSKEAEDHLAIDFNFEAERDITLATIACPDRNGLVAQLAGAFALGGATIIDARIFTLRDGMALDVFSLQDATGKAIHPERLSRLQSLVKKVLDNPDQELPRLDHLPLYTDPHARAFPVSPRIRMEKDASDDYTVIEISARDRRGLVYRIASLFTQLHCNIAHAKVSTFGHRAVDVFYILGPDGKKIADQVLLSRLRSCLEDLLQDR